MINFGRIPLNLANPVNSENGRPLKTQSFIDLLFENDEAPGDRMTSEVRMLSKAFFYFSQYSCLLEHNE